MAENVRTIQGKDVYLFVRRLKDAKTDPGKLIPYQTSLSFDPSRDSDTTQTKSGVVTTSAAIETDLEVEFVNNTSAIADALYDYFFANELLELWVVFIDRFNEEGKVKSFYMRGTISEDSSDNDPDDNSTRDVTFAIQGTPKGGWSKLPESAMEQLEYVYRGLEALGESTTNGTPWKESDAGTDVPKTTSTSKPTNTVTRTEN